MPCLQVLGALFLLAAWLVVEPVGAARITDDPNGFNGYTWGAAMAAFPSLKLVKDLGSTDFVSSAGVYEIPGEALALNGVPLSQIHYRFIDGQLESIQLRYAGRENRDKLMRWVEDHYGKVTPADRKMINAVQWFGDKTTVTLKWDFAAQQGVLWFMSQALSHKFNEFHQATQGD
jgi:hypothetical protein